MRSAGATAASSMASARLQSRPSYEPATLQAAGPVDGRSSRLEMSRAGSTRMNLPAVKGVPMNPVTHLFSGIRSFRPFLPAKEFETSLRFYKAIGFEAYRLGETLAELSLGAHAFLLQDT